MTDKQKRFVDEYLISLNASDAYAKAYNYKGKQADTLGTRTMNKPEVKKLISKKLEKINEELDIKAIDVLRELKELAFSDIKDYLSFDGNGVTFKKSSEFDNLKVISEVSSRKTTTGGKDKGGIVSNVDFKLKLYDKQKALEMLGRYFKLFTERVEVEVVDEAEVNKAVRQRLGL